MMMGINKSNRSYAIPWGITGLVVVGLLVATILLAYRSHTLPVNGLVGSVTDLNPTVYMREHPTGSSKIVTILERGSNIRIIDVTSNAGISWLKVESGRFSGWLPAANVAFDLP